MFQDNIEKQSLTELTNERMPMPEILAKEEKGQTLLSILLRGYKYDFGSHDHKLSRKIDNFFAKNPLDKKSMEFLKKLRALQYDGIDGETLFNIALTYENENRVKDLHEFLVKYKKLQNPDAIRENLLTIIKNLKKTLPQDLIDEYNKATRKDIEKRKKSIEEPKQRIEKLIDFFKPKAKTTKIKKVILLPTNFLMPEKSGVAFIFGDNLYISSHINNPHNLEHEFLHCVINPIVDKLSKKLTEKEKQKISNLASYELKAKTEDGSQGYGDDYYSLLCEEFIRTYNDVFQYNKKPISYEDFMQAIEGVSSEQFETYLENKESFKKQCSKLGIKTFDDFKKKSREYFNAFKKNDLRNIIFEFYQNFAKEKEKNPNITFEDFVLKNFKDVLSKS